jgi:two-component system, cell cycle response regulator
VGKRLSDSEESPDDTNTKTAHPMASEKPKRDRPYLIVLAGTSMGAMHLLDKEITVIGRAEKADLRIIDDGISREHSRVLREGDQIVLEDLGSTNGTYCNATRVTRQPLSEGDKIMIGTGTILKFTFHDEIDEVFQQQLTESALRDPLTRTYHKKFFLDRIQSEFT